MHAEQTVGIGPNGADAKARPQRQRTLVQRIARRAAQLGRQRHRLLQRQVAQQIARAGLQAQFGGTHLHLALAPALPDSADISTGPPR